MRYGDSLSSLSLASSYTGGFSDFPIEFLYLGSQRLWLRLLIGTEETWHVELLYVCDRHADQESLLRELRC